MTSNLPFHHWGFTRKIGIINFSPSRQLDVGPVGKPITNYILRVKTYNSQVIKKSFWSTALLKTSKGCRNKGNIGKPIFLTRLKLINVSALWTRPSVDGTYRSCNSSKLVLLAWAWKLMLLACAWKCFRQKEFRDQDNSKSFEPLQLP